MASPTLRHALALVLLAAGTAITTAGCIDLKCGDEEGEVDASTTCNRVGEAVNRALAGCGLGAQGLTAICGRVCSTSGIRCADEPDVDACVAGITQLGCDVLGAEAYKDLEACADLFEFMVDSCDKGGDDDDTFDD